MDNLDWKSVEDYKKISTTSEKIKEIWIRIWRNNIGTLPTAGPTAGANYSIKSLPSNQRDNFKKELVKELYGFCVRNSIVENHNPERCKKFFSTCAKSNNLDDINSVDIDLSKNVCLFTDTKEQKRVVSHQAIFGKQLNSDGVAFDEIFLNKLRTMYITVGVRNISMSDHLLTSEDVCVQNYVFDKCTEFAAIFGVSTSPAATSSSITAYQKGANLIKELKDNNIFSSLIQLRKYYDFFQEKWLLGGPMDRNKLLTMLGPPPMLNNYPAFIGEVDKDGKMTRKINYARVPGNPMGYPMGYPMGIPPYDLPPGANVAGINYPNYPWEIPKDKLLPFPHIGGSAHLAQMPQFLQPPQMFNPDHVNYMPPLHNIFMSMPRAKNTHMIKRFNKNTGPYRHAIIRYLLLDGCTVDEMKNHKSKLMKNNLHKIINEVGNLSDDEKKSLELLLMIARQHVGMNPSLEIVPFNPMPMPMPMHPMPNIKDLQKEAKKGKMFGKPLIHKPYFVPPHVLRKEGDTIKMTKGSHKDPIWPAPIVPGVIPPMYPGLYGGNFPKLNITKDMVGGTVFKIIPLFMNRGEIHDKYSGLIKSFPKHLQGGEKLANRPFPQNFPKIVAYPHNRYDEFIQGIDKNKHFIYQIKKMIDFYLGIGRKHNIDIPFESKIRDLLKSIHINHTKYVSNIIELQDLTTIKVNKRDLSINTNDLKYEKDYSVKVNNQIEVVNNSRRILFNELKILFLMEEILYNLVKYKLAENYIE